MMNDETMNEMISPKEFVCTECLYFFVARDMSRPMGRRRKRNTCFTLTYLPHRREGAKRTEATKFYLLILSSGKKNNIAVRGNVTVYPEGVKQPSQGQRPWYTVAVITAAPAGHNNQ